MGGVGQHDTRPLDVVAKARKVIRMRLCSHCTSSTDSWNDKTAPPGRCSECGRAFDIQGLPVLDESITCPLHDPILASCPHPSDGHGVDAPAPAASWLADDTAGG
jgi:hypothetical protein